MTTPSADSPLDELVGYHLRRLSLLTMSDLAATLEPLDLRPTEVSILLVISASPGITQSGIGRGLGIQRANVTPLITSMEARGLLTRTRVDGRSHALRLTAEGSALSAKALEAARDSDRRCFAALDKGARRKLAEQLRQLWMTIENAT